MRVNLKVPFAEKDEAKKLGARWDAARKIWFVDNQGDLAPFSRWSPTPHDASSVTPSSPKGSAARPQQSPGKLVVGSDFVARPPVCECLPWEVCSRCDSMALSV